MKNIKGLNAANVYKPLFFTTWVLGGGALNYQKMRAWGHRFPTAQFACGARSMRGRAQARGRGRGAGRGAAEASGPATDAAGSSASSTAVPRKRKRESVLSSNLLAGSDAENDADDSSLTSYTNMPNAHKEELDEYLTLPQIENNGER